MIARRALSEVIGSLIILTVVSIAMLTYSSLYMKTAKGLEEATSSAVNAVDDKFMAPILMPDLYNGDLVLNIIPVKPIKIKYIITISNNSINIVNVSRIIGTISSFTLAKNYTCEPLFISLVTDSGVLIRYSPLHDPRVELNNLSSKEIEALEHGYVDCNVLGILKSAGSNISLNRLNDSKTMIYDGQGKYVSLAADPPILSILEDPNDAYTVNYFNITINGSLSSGQASLTFKALDANGFLLSEKEIAVQGPGAKASYLFTLYTSLGDAVPVYAKVSCTSSSCVAGLFFESNRTYIITGQASLTETIRYDLAVNRCPYSKLSFTLPMVLAPRSNFTSTVSGTCSLQWGIHVSMKGQAGGSFETWGPLIFAASTAPNLDIRISINLWVREAVKVVTLRPAVLQLPLHGPIAYSLIPVNITAKDSLTEAVLKFISDNNDNVDLLVVAEGLSSRRPITASQQVIPLLNANYTLEAWLGAYVPFITKLVVSYHTSQKLDNVVNYEWNLTVKESPLPDPSLPPLLVKVESLENNTKYLISISRAFLTIAQGGSTYKGLAPLLGGAPAAISPASDSYTFFIFKGEGSIASSLEMQASIFYDPKADATLEVDPSTGNFVTPSQQSVYLIVPVMQNADFKSQNSPPVAWIIVY